MSVKCLDEQRAAKLLLKALLADHGQQSFLPATHLPSKLVWLEFYSRQEGYEVSAEGDGQFPTIPVRAVKSYNAPSQSLDDKIGKR